MFVCLFEQLPACCDLQKSNPKLLYLSGWLANSSPGRWIQSQQGHKAALVWCFLFLFLSVTGRSILNAVPQLSEIPHAKTMGKFILVVQKYCTCDPLWLTKEGDVGTPKYRITKKQDRTGRDRMGQDRIVGRDLERSLSPTA